MIICHGYVPMPLWGIAVARVPPVGVAAENADGIGCPAVVAGDVFYETYESGLAQGEKNIDMELAKKAENGDIDAIELLEERKNERYFKDLRKELFGI